MQAYHAERRRRMKCVEPARTVQNDLDARFPLKHLPFFYRNGFSEQVDGHYRPNGTRTFGQCRSRLFRRQRARFARYVAKKGRESTEIYGMSATDERPGRQQAVALLCRLASQRYRKGDRAVADRDDILPGKAKMRTDLGF